MLTVISGSHSLRAITEKKEFIRGPQKYKLKMAAKALEV